MTFGAGQAGWDVDFTLIISPSVLSWHYIQFLGIHDSARLELYFQLGTNFKPRLQIIGGLLEDIILNVIHSYMWCRCVLHAIDLASIEV